jgi:dienelactone hydrolase
MIVMRRFLKRIGYNVFTLDAGRNFEPPEERIMSVDDATAFREKMVAIIAKRLEQIYQQTEQKVALIGWSMGGCYALDLSQQYPEYTSKVITLGTPFGDPRGTLAWNVLRKMNKSQVAIEDMNFASWMAKCEIKTSDIPIHVLYSDNDGIVNPSIAKLPEHPSVIHHQIESSHVAFAFNKKAYKAIAELLNS